jgi:hypothetical protein
MQKELETESWWQTRLFFASAIVVSIVPLLWPLLPPLTDLPGHIGRYRIMAEAGTGPLAHYYAVQWSLIGNLGVDAIVLALSPLFDVELTAKWVVVAIPALTTAAMLWAAREGHGRISPAAAFALPLAYSMPFQMGFVNFALSAAIAIAGLAWWIHLAGKAPDWVRIIAFVPVAGIVWVCHSFGWAMLGLFVLGAEFSIRRARGEGVGRAVRVALLASAPMAWPQVLIMLFGTAPHGNTGEWFFWVSKAQSVAAVLREQWRLYDVASAIVLVSVVWTAVRANRLSFVPVLGVPALLGLAAFLLLPGLYEGGAYVDMRILPYVLALALLSIRVVPGDVRLANRLAIAGAAFFALRIATSTLAFVSIAHEQQAELGAITAIPPGAAVLTLVHEPPPTDWAIPRLRHLAGIAIARRRVFTNEQWAIVGQQLIRPLTVEAAPLDRDPSQLAGFPGDKDAPTDFDTAIARFDRNTFGYVWTIAFAPGLAHATDLHLVWTNGRSALYLVSVPNARLSVPPRAR